MLTSKRVDLSLVVHVDNVSIFFLPGLHFILFFIQN